MSIRSFAGNIPNIAESAYVDDTALVIGNVTIGEHSSIWPMTVVRGDVHTIQIGQYTNIQDASICHVTHDGKYTPGGIPLSVGNYVTVGHRVTLHACAVGHYCLIGMSTTVMDGSVIGDHSMVGAGSLVPTGKELEGGYLYVGSPVKRVRELTEKERTFLEYSAVNYAKLKDEHKNPD